MNRKPSPRALEAIVECCALLRAPRPPCHEWLRHRLAQRPAPILDTWSAATAAGFDDHEIDHAARRLGVRVVDGDTWRLP